MAVVAKIQADFREFQTALKNAEKSIDGLGAAVGVSDRAIAKLGDGFAGDALVRKAVETAKAVEAIGGATNLTDREMVRVNRTVTEAIDKMAKLGVDAPADLRKIQAETQGAADATTNFGARITGLVAASAAAVAAFSKVATILTDWVTSANGAEDATAKLDAALRTQGTYTPTLSKQFAELASEFEQTTKFSDDLLMEVEGLFTMMGVKGPRDMRKALTATTDLASGLRIDLTTAAGMVAKAMDGNTVSLKKAGIAIDSVTLQTEGATVVFDAIAKKMGGQAAAAAEAFSGQMDQLDNRIDNVQETLGGFIKSAITPALDLFNVLPESVKNGAIALGLVGAAAVALTTAVIGLSAAIALAAPVLGFSAAAVGASAIAGLGTAAGVATAALGPLAIAVGAVFIAIKIGEIESVKNSIAEWGLASENLTARLYRAITGIDKMTVAEAHAAVAATAAAEKQAALATSTVNVGQAKDTAAPKVISYTKHLADAQAKVDGLTNAQKTEILAAQKSGETNEYLFKTHGMNTAAMSILVEAHSKEEAALKRHAAEVDKAAKAQQKFLDSVKNLTSVLVPFKTAVDDVGQSLHDLPSESFADFAKKSGEANAELEKWKKANLQVVPAMHGTKAAVNEIATSTSALKDTLTVLAQAFSNLSTVSGESLSSLARSVGVVINAISLAGQSGATLKSGFSELNGENRNLVGAFGKIASGAISAAAAIEQAAQSSKNLTAASLSAAAAGAQAGSAFGPVGSIIGATIGFVRGFETAAGAARAATATLRDAISTLQQRLSDLIPAGLDAGKMFAFFGLSMDDVLSNDPATFFANLKVFVDTFEKKLKEAQQALADLRTKLADTKTELDGLLSSAEKIGYVFDQAGQLTGVTFAAMQRTAKELGLDLTALGPAFVQAGLNEKAMDFVNKLILLKLGGADMEKVLKGTAKQMSELVNESIKMGTTLPENLKPFIEALIASGDLVDANGNKITDVSNIKFGAPIKTEYEKIQGAIVAVIEKMNDLIAKIADFVEAIEKATKPRTVDIGFNVAPIPALPGDSGGGGDGPGLASGSKRMMGSWFRNFGGGTAAVLHGDEAVVTRGQVGEFTRDMGGADTGLASEMAGLRADFAGLPRLMARAVRDAILVAG